MSIPTQRKPDYKSAWIFPILGIIAAFTYALLVFPNSFAPAGVGGISTMLQYALKVDAGILNLMINVPILITAWFLVDREFVVKSMLFTAFFSGGMIALRAVDPAILARYQYTSTNGNSTILAPIAAAVIIGSLYGVTLRKHDCTGGTDVLSFCIRRYHPEYNVTWIGFTLNAVIAVVSFFVYGHQFEPVICCILYCFVVSFVSEEPEKLAADLMEHLKHGVTMLPAEGAYTHEHKSLVICIVNKHQIADIQSIIARYPGSFTYITSVSETLGNFRKIK